MAYIGQDTKKKIAAAIKALNLPKAWKVSLSIRHHSGLRVSIARAPATVLDDYIPSQFQLERNPEFTVTVDKLYVNEHNISTNWRGPTLKVLERIMDAVKTAGEWFDKSDAMSDYFHTAFYIDLKFGTSTTECELVGNRRTKSEAIARVAEELGVPVIAVTTVETEAGDLLGVSITADEDGINISLDDECATHTADRANVVPLFVAEKREPTLVEKQAIARDELIRRFKSNFAATPAGASLNDTALTVLAEAALTTVLD
jgi:hypothetical protein